MITRSAFAYVALAVLCFGGSFLGTVMLRSEAKPVDEPAKTSPVANCLALEPEQAKLIEGRDPKFANDFRSLASKLEGARLGLAGTFEDPSVSDDEIRRHVEEVITAHNALERRVAEYLIAVRDQLTPAQQGRLFGMCASRVRECCKMWRGQCSVLNGVPPCGAGTPSCKSSCTKRKPCGGGARPASQTPEPNDGEKKTDGKAPAEEGTP